MISIVSLKNTEYFFGNTHLSYDDHVTFDVRFAVMFIITWLGSLKNDLGSFYSDTLWALMGAIKKWLGHTKRVPTTTSTGLISVIDKWNQEKFYFREKLTRKKKIKPPKNQSENSNFWRKIVILEKCANFIIKNASISCIFFACVLLYFGGQFIIEDNSQSASASLFNKLVIHFPCQKGCTRN